MRDENSEPGRSEPRLQRASSETGSAHGEIGYQTTPRGYSSDGSELSASNPDHAISEPSKNLLAKMAPLPPLRRIPVVGRTGKTYEVPALANASDLSTIKDQIEALQIELSPVDPREVIARMTTLLAHYGQQAPITPGASKAFWLDWMNDMATASAKAFGLAVTAWRQSPERFKPTPGLLLSLIREIEAPLRERLSLCLELERVETGATIVRNVPSGPLTAADVKRGRIQALVRERADRANRCLPFRFVPPNGMDDRDWCDLEVKRLDREIAELQAMEG